MLCGLDPVGAEGSWMLEQGHHLHELFSHLMEVATIYTQAVHRIRQIDWLVSASQQYSNSILIRYDYFSSSLTLFQEHVFLCLLWINSYPSVSLTPALLPLWS